VTGGGALNVTVTAAVAETRVLEQGAELPLMQCTVNLIARAGDGDRDRPAEWRGARFRYFIGSDRSTPADSIDIPVAAVHQLWNSGILAPNGTSSGTWVFTAGLPFSGEVVFHYEVDGEGHSAQPVTFHCGPQPTTAPPPGQPTVSVPAEVELGGALPIDFQASAPAGLWAVMVRVTGPFARDTVLSYGYGSPGYNGRVVLQPPPLPTGTAATVQVFAMDVYGRYQASEMAVSRLVDRTPPVLQSITPTFAGSVSMPVPGGDSLLVAVQGSDNGGLSHLVYEFSGAFTARDSVPMPATGSSVKVPVGQGWSGEGTLTAWLRDQSGNRSAPASAQVRVYPTRAATTRSAALPDFPYALGRAPGGDAVYLGMGDAGVIRLPLSTLVPSAAFGQDGYLLAVAQDGRSVWTGNGKRLSWTDPTDPTRGATVALPGYLFGVAAMSSGRVLLAVLDTTPEPRQMRYFSTAPGLALDYLRDQLGTVSGSGGMVAGWNGERVLIDVTFECARVYVVATNSFGGCSNIGHTGRLSANQAGDRFMKGLAPLAASGAPVRWPSTTQSPPSAISADGEYAFVMRFGGIDRIRLSDNVPVEHFVVAGVREWMFEHDGWVFLASPTTLIAVVRDYTGGGNHRVYAIALPG
jgi:hypothetical protein